MAIVIRDGRLGMVCCITEPVKNFFFVYRPQTGWCVRGESPTAGPLDRQHVRPTVPRRVGGGDAREGTLVSKSADAGVPRPGFDLIGGGGLPDLFPPQTSLEVDLLATALSRRTERRVTGTFGRTSSWERGRGTCVLAGDAYLVMDETEAGPSRTRSRSEDPGHESRLRAREWTECGGCGTTAREGARRSLARGRCVPFRIGSGRSSPFRR